jgi:hypothetical protein
MTWTVAAAAVLMMASLLGAAVMRERSLRRLTPEQKVLLLDAFASSRILFPTLAVAVVILYIIAVAAGASIRTAYFGALVGPFLALMASSHVMVLKRLRRLGMPEEYRRSFNRARLLAYAGIGVFLAIMIDALSPA